MLSVMTRFDQARALRQLSTPDATHADDAQIIVSAGPHGSVRVEAVDVLGRVQSMQSYATHRREYAELAREFAGYLRAHDALISQHLGLDVAAREYHIRGVR